MTCEEWQATTHRNTCALGNAQLTGTNLSSSAGMLRGAGSMVSTLCSSSADPMVALLSQEAAGGHTHMHMAEPPYLKLPSTCVQNREAGAHLRKVKSHSHSRLKPLLRLGSYLLHPEESPRKRDLKMKFHALLAFRKGPTEGTKTLEVMGDDPTVQHLHISVSMGSLVLPTHTHHRFLHIYSATGSHQDLQLPGLWATLNASILALRSSAAGHQRIFPFSFVEPRQTNVRALYIPAGSPSVTREPPPSWICFPGVSRKARRSCCKWLMTNYIQRNGYLLQGGNVISLTIANIPLRRKVN